MRRLQPHAQCFDGLSPIDDFKKCIKHGHSVMILMRGPPGCGKTHLAEELVACRTVDAEDTRKPVILSTDRFFITPNGRYAFDQTRLDEFHKKNQNDAKTAMENNQSPVIIDNTNLQLAHMKMYINHAIKWCYEIYIVEPQTPWNKDARQLAKKNKHFVDELRIANMISSFERVERFADLLKPVPFVVNRVDFSSDEEGDDSGFEQKMPPPLLSLNLDPPPLSVLCHQTQRSLNGCISIGPPPGIDIGPVPLQQQQQQPSPIISMSLEPLLTVQQRDVGCQATVGLGLMHETDLDIPDDVAAICFSLHDEHTTQRRRGAVTRDAETDTPCPQPNQITVFSTAFPTVPVEDIEVYAVDYPSSEYVQFLLEMKYDMDCVASIPWLQEDFDRSLKGKRGRHKDLTSIFSEPTTPVLSPKMRMGGWPRIESMTWRGEGCGASTEDQTSVSTSLSNESWLEERGEPLAAAFGEDELIVLDINQPIKNLLELFFGHNSRKADVHMPLWLLRLVHRAAKGEMLTKNALYHEEYPSIDLCTLADEKVAMQQQMRDDAEIARQLHAEESRRERSSVTDSFTPDQIEKVRALRAKYPAADPEVVAEMFKTMCFDFQCTIEMLSSQFGEAAHILPTPAHALPASVLAPPPPAVPTPPPSRSVSATNFMQQHQQYSQRVQQGRVSTHLANGRITDVGKMAAANGAAMTQTEVQNEFARLHELRADRQDKIDVALKKAQSVRDHHTRGYYGLEIKRLRSLRIEVDEEIKELGVWWNANLNSDVIDLHFMLADQAMEMLKERINFVKDNIRRGGTKRLTVITGTGNNSAGGTSEIKKRVMAMIHSNKYMYNHNNNGCVVIQF